MSITSPIISYLPRLISLFMICSGYHTVPSAICEIFSKFLICGILFSKLILLENRINRILKNNRIIEY